jgi:preprotein translocase SecF subunit
MTKPGMAEVQRKALLEMLAGGVAPVDTRTVAGPTVVEILPAAGHGIRTVDITSPPIPAAREKEAVSALRFALERADDWTVADPFPRRDQIGPAVAKNLKSKAYIAVVLACVTIVLYVALRFELIWGVAAIVAIAHDVLVTIGFMSIVDLVVSTLGIDFDSKFNLPTIAAFLTLIGFSIDNTIVILDRIREMLKVKKVALDAAAVNEAVNATLSRTVLTVVTVFFVSVVLLGCSFFGLGVIQGFSLAMCFGLLAGAYSSHLIAPPIILAQPRKTWTVLGIQAAVLIVLSIAVPWVMG